MANRKTTEVRNTGVCIPDICFGTSALGNMPDTYTYEVDEKRAVETIKTILASEFPFIDTGRNYGMGRSEERIGIVIKELGGVPEGAIISTKLDRNMDTGLFDASEARRSIEESFAALGVCADVVGKALSHHRLLAKALPIFPVAERAAGLRLGHAKCVLVL